MLQPIQHLLLNQKETLKSTSIERLFIKDTKIQQDYFHCPSIY